jgi:hypothetical protein
MKNLRRNSLLFNKKYPEYIIKKKNFCLFFFIKNIKKKEEIKNKK